MAKLSKVITQSEKRLRRKLEKQLAKLGKDIATVIEVEQKSLFEDIRLIIDKQFEGIVENLAKITKKVIKTGQRIMSSDDLPFDVDTQKLDQAALDYLNNLETLNLSDAEGSIKYTTKRKVIDLLGEGLANGDAPKVIASKILQQVDSGVFSKARAELIAVREVGNAYESGRWNVVEQGVQLGYRYEKIRDTVNDERVTEQCRENEAMGRIDRNATFASGDDHAPRNSNPRCRCTTNYRLAE